jgi:hypothetical protein
MGRLAAGYSFFGLIQHVLKFVIPAGGLILRRKYSVNNLRLN